MTSLAVIGGLWFILTFIHFVADWMFQTHADAVAKSTDTSIRARHCAIYTAFFIPIFMFIGCSWIAIATYVGILFMSHFIEDSYVPVLWWMRHIRKVPWFTKGQKTGYSTKSPYLEIIPLTDKEAWTEFAQAEPALSFILLITVDQIVHIFFLGVIAGLMYYAV